MFQFTHPVWGATLAKARLLLDGEVSIHAPRVGCDEMRLAERLQSFRVSIHAPRVGCDQTAPSELGAVGGFNSRTPCGVRLDHT